MNDVSQPEWMQNHVHVPHTGNWKPGQSGNPAGKPKGVPDKRAKLFRQMLDNADGILDAIVAKAKEGDAASAALVLSRIVPTLRSQTERVTFTFDPELPIVRQVEQVLSAVAAGDVPPDVGQTIIAMIGTLANTRALEELEPRIAAIEGKVVNP